MTENVETLPLTSLDIARDRVAALRETFPDVFREGKIDFDALKQALGEEVDTGPERYGLSWAGKSTAIRNLQTPSIATLVPDREESVDFDTTGNVFIEGENLEVLKLLQQAYYGKIKMIYIDPPYNTGHEFIYPDNFREPLDTYLRYSGQVDGNGLKLSTNTETSGRYHSNWLNMMYPRLFLARNLLREDGVIFVSIDDHEVHNLRLLMDEVFGEENLVAVLPWQSRQSVQNDTDISVNHEYVLGYARHRRTEQRRLKDSNQAIWDRIGGFAAYPLPLDPSRFSNPDNDPRGPWKADPFDAPGVRRNLTYAISNSKTGEEHWPPKGRHWRTEEKTYRQLLSEGRISFGGVGSARPQLKVFFKEKQAFGTVATTWLDAKIAGTATRGTQELQQLFGGQSPFDTAKPTALINALAAISTRSTDLVLDFFAGSCSSAHALLALNCKDGGNRRFIMVQLPEPTPDDSAARQLGYNTIADIGKERIRRVGARLRQESAGQLPLESTPQDLGFKVFKLTTSNFRVWDATSAQTPEQLSRQLELHIDHIEPGATPERILYEILLKSGFALTAPVERVTVAGKACFAVAGGLLLVCLEEVVTEEAMRGMIARGPRQIACLDAAFDGNDQLKTNTVLQMRDAEIVFHTV